jgi:sterol desaturase/sphingolipid hydroxylase (fatty acid hydroxylase superfamily)
MRIEGQQRIETALKFGLYPLLLGTTLWYAWFELSQPAEQLGRYYGYYLAALVGLLTLVETLHPMRKDWKMTMASFLRRDLPFLLIGSTTIALANYAGGWMILILGFARGESHLALPLVPAVILALIIPDLLWYWLHRFSHEAKGKLGQWLWRVHAAHHLPQQVYVMMHSVAHPLNTIAVRMILTVPLFLLGFSTEAIFTANLILGLQGLFSHFNVDIRAGWLNYVLTGTELHRYHHSANSAEAMNYGAVVPLWDILFGTFVYRPGIPPRALGVANPSEYPADREILGVLGWPFSRPQ